MTIFIFRGRKAYLNTESGGRTDGLCHAQTAANKCGAADNDPLAAGGVIVTRSDFSYVRITYDIFASIHLLLEIDFTI